MRRVIEETKYQEKIEQSLAGLDLSQQCVDDVAPQILKRAKFIAKKGTNLNTDDSFFDFEGKVDTVVDALSPYGLTEEAYLNAACKQPYLFYGKPHSIIARYRHAKAMQSEGIIANGEDILVYMINKPETLTLSLDNYELRHVFYGKEKELSRKKVLRTSRKYIEQSFVDHQHQPIKKDNIIPNLHQNKTDLCEMTCQELANIGVRAMVRSQILKNYSLG